MKFLFAIFFVLFIWSPAYAAADRLCYQALAALPDFDEKTYYSFKKLNPAIKFSHGLGHSQLGRMSGKNSATNQKTFGLTVANMKTAVSADFLMVEVSGGVCVYPVNVNVDFGYEDIVVYIASELSRNSCGFGVTMKHEEVHVQIYLRYLDQFESSIKNSVSQAVKSQFPMKLRSANNAEKIGLEVITDNLLRSITQMETQRDREHDLLDSPQSYRKWQSMCSEW